MCYNIVGNHSRDSDAAMKGAIDPVEAFFGQLRGSGLLSPQQLQEIGQWIVQQRLSLAALLAAIERRGWLTSFQLREIAQGRGRSLRIGPYVLLDLLGEGGMGRVYRAQHTRMGRLCAIKVIRRDKLKHPAMAERFRREIEAAARMHHPNVIRVFNADQTDDLIYYEMELVDGLDLTKLVRQQGPLPIPQACEYIRLAALGLQHAYEQGLVHRDLKPSNILVSHDGRQVKLVDLGLARILDEPPEAEKGKRLTREGYVLGTPDFLAPEQARNPTLVDIRADIYSLGGTLYYILTGRVPYEASTPTEKLLRHCTEPPPPLLPYRPDAPPQLEQIIHWCMAKQPEQRPQTPLQVVLALEPLCRAGGPHPAIPWPAAPPQEPRSSQLFQLPEDLQHDAVLRRNRQQLWGRWIVTTLILALAVLMGVALLRKMLPLWQTPLALAPYAESFTNTLGLRMVRLPADTFVMGSPDIEPGRRDDEGPAVRVRFSQPWWIAATEVTTEQFQQIMGYNPSRSGKLAAQHARRPVESVRWDEAMEFCRRLTEREKNEPWIRPGWGYRLPTEAEWEYAARAGSTSPFTFGNILQFGRQAIFQPVEDDPLQTGGDPARPPAFPEPVGQTQPNRFGLHDLHGNVAEWCLDWYAPRDPARGGEWTDPTGPADGERRVVRGGSFRLPAARCRSAARDSWRPTERRDDLGFRIVFAPLRQAP